MSRAPGGGGRRVLVLLAVGLLGLLAAGLLAGPTSGGPLDLMAALRTTSVDADDPLVLAVWQARLPRTLLAAGLGAALATAGLLTQQVADNRLATPSLLGVHNGANLALIVALVALPEVGEAGLVAAALAGAFAVSLLVIAIGQLPAARREPTRWLLVGVLLDRLAAVAAAAVLFAHAMQNALLGWTVGRLVHVDWLQVQALFAALAIALPFACWLLRALDVLQLGDDVARGLGLPVRAVQAAALLLVVLLSGTATAVAGPVAYVGLVVPNLLRRCALPTPWLRGVAVALGGACCTAAADLVVRALPTGRELPLGLCTMAIGAAFFLGVTLLPQPLRRAS